MSQPTLIYDANCRLCSASKLAIERWDRRRQIRFVHFQTTEAREKVPVIAGQTCLDAIRFLDREGRRFVGVDAFVALLAELPMGKAVQRLFDLPGIMPLARLAYRQVAAHRYQWFGATDRTPRHRS